MDNLLVFLLAWGFVGAVLAVGFLYLGPSFVIWVAGGLAFVVLSPFQLPNLSDPVQVATWSICIILYLLAWYLFIKPTGTDKPAKRTIKPPKELVVGETGEVIEEPGESSEQMVRLLNPIQGTTDWKIIPLEELNTGDRVVVVDLVGKSLVVKKPESNW